MEIPIIVVPPYESLIRVEQQLMPNGYLHDTYSIILRPNPLLEEIDMFSIQCEIYVDEVVVDTICIPEPSMICLLSLGALIQLQKRRA